MKLKLSIKEIEKIKEGISYINQVIPASTISYMDIERKFEEIKKEGFRSGALKVAFDKELNVVFEVDNAFAVQAIEALSSFALIVTPQFFSIVAACKSLSDQLYKAEKPYIDADLAKSEKKAAEEKAAEEKASAEKKKSIEKYLSEAKENISIEKLEALMK